jgi:arginyl-tRNA synthetase
MGFTCSLEHISFGSMRFKDKDGNYTTGSTRKGNVPLLDEFLDLATERARRGGTPRAPSCPRPSLSEVARVVGIGAIKYNDLSRDRQQDIQFDLDKALALDGNTAPYMQYAYARLRSIARKAEAEGFQTADSVTLVEPAERRLGRRLLDYATVVETTARTARPHHLCEYLFDLAGVVSTFYTELPVLKAEPAVRASRLALLALVAKTLRHGLALLGIEVPERM